jgi:hypothetical protein
MAVKLADKVHETTTTTGTGNVSLAGAVPGRRTFLAAIGATNQTYYVIEQSDVSGVVTDWEIGLGTVIAGSPGQLQRNTILASTNSNLIVNWGAGVKNVYGTVAAGAILLVAGLLAEIAALGTSSQDAALVNLGATTLGKALIKAASAAAARTSLGLGTAAVLDVGTVALKVLQLDAAGKIPAVDGSQLLSLPRPAGLALTLTGGSNNQVLRSSGAGTLTAASRTDTPDLLRHLFVKGNDGNLYTRGMVVPFSGVAAGNRYFLSTAGGLTTTIPTPQSPASTITQVDIGQGVDTGLLYFDPQAPIGGQSGFGGSGLVDLYLENGNLVVL